MQTVTAVINRSALKYNLKQLRKLAPNSKLAVVVKANAYGHGLLETTKTLADTDAFGVARLEEALKLREGGIKQPILLLEGFFSYNELFVISNYQFQTVVHSIEQLEALEILELKKPITVWMKLDIGMHRLGIRQEQAEIFYRRLICCKNIQYPINIFSHFSCANEPELNITKKQLNNFSNFCKDKPGLRSVAASSSILLYPESHLDLVRPGIIIYGISPIKGNLSGIDFGFKPAMSLVSSLIAIRKHKAGEPVGYGETWISKHDTHLGVIAIGYGDGYPRAIPSGTPVIINNREVIIVGSVTMDMICVDLGLHIQDKVGDSVILWGDSLPVERIAQITGVSSYELITRLTSRVVMRYID